MSARMTTLGAGGMSGTRRKRDGRIRCASLERLERRLVLNAADTRFVGQAYLDLLGRPADSAGLAYWTGQLDAGAQESGIAQQLTHSAEYYGNEIIKPAYETYLARDPDTSGLSFWIGQMQQGLTDERLEAGFIGSPEFYARAGGTDLAWVDAMYQDLLARPADPGGQTYWVGQLQQGASRSDVAYGFAASLEREGQRIQADYQHFLRRGATPSEVQYWVGQFANGMTNESVIGGFIGSPEYFSFAQTSPDTQPPTIVDTVPADGASTNLGSQTVRIDFSKPMDATTITANTLQLVGTAGAILPTTVQLSSSGQTVDLTYPPLTAGDYELTIHAPSITDTTGIALGTTDVVEHFHVSPDTQPPTIVNTFPADGTSTNVGAQDVRIGFSKPMDATTITANTVQLAGIAGAVLPTSVQLTSSGQTADLTYPPLTVGDYQLTIHAASIADTTGIALGNADVIEHFHVVNASDIWINPVGGDWNDPTNWSTGLVPGPGDDVLVNSPGGATISYSGGGATIKSLTSANPLDLSGGSITLTNGASVIDGALAMSNSAQLVVQPVTPGAGATLTATGTVSVDTGAELLANGGGLIDLSALTSFSGPSDGGAIIQAIGAGSKVDLSNLAVLHGATGTNVVSLFANQGGLLDLHRLTQIPDGVVQINATDPGSTIDLSAMTTFTAALSGPFPVGGVDAANGGTVLVPLLTNVRNFTLTLDGATSSINTSQLTSVDTLGVFANDGAVMDLSGVESYTGPKLPVPPIPSFPPPIPPPIDVEGRGSRINLSNLIVIHGAASYNAGSGGTLDMHDLAQIPDGEVQFSAFGANTTIDVSALTTYTSAGPSSLWEAGDDGTILAPRLTTLHGISLFVSGAGSSISTAQLTNVDTLDVNASDGAVVDLSGVTSYGGPNYFNLYASGVRSLIDLSNLTAVDGTAGGQLDLDAVDGGRLDLRRLTQVAGGGLHASVADLNSAIDLSALTVIHGGITGNAVSLNATQGGLLDLRHLMEIPDGNVQVNASDANSTIDVSALTTFTATSGFNNTLEAHGGGMVLIPLLNSVANFTLTVDGAMSGINTSQLTNVDAISVNALNGGVVDLSAVTSLTGNYSSVLEASGPGSKIELPNLSILRGTASGGGPILQALAGGLLDLHALTQILDAGAQISASDPDSEIDLSVLTTFTATTTGTLEAHNGGTVLAPLLSAVSNLRLTLDGATSSISTAQIPNIDAINVYAENGAALDLSGVTTYSARGGYQAIVEASGEGSTINLSNLTVLYGATNGIPAVLNALAGGALDLRRLAQITDGSVEIDATGAKSQIDVSGLTAFTANGYGAGSQGAMQASDGGSINMGTQTTTVSNVEIALSSNSSLTVGTLVLSTGATLDGSGTLTGNLTNGGSVAPGVPGQTTGSIIVSGNYVQTSAGTLYLKLGGTSAGTQFDQFIVDGTATLAGTLDLALVNAFAPATGSTFPIVIFTSSSGTFATVNGTDAGNGHSFVVSYEPADVKLSVT